MFKKALVLSPHTDDAELGAGGTIANLAEKGCETSLFVFSWCENKKNIKACKEACEILGIDKIEIFDIERRHFPEQRQDILQIMYDYNIENKIDLVLTPTTTDLHQDHITVTKEAMRAFKGSTILGYEIPWNNIQITTNCFIPLQKKYVDKKIQALNCYETQKDRHYFDDQYFESILKMRGTQIQTKYAEAFEVIKYVPML